MTMICRTLTEFCVDLFWLGNKISCLVISNANFYHLIKGSISHTHFFWNADKISHQNRWYRSLFHPGAGKQVTPSFFGYVSLFTSTQSQFSLSPVKRESKGEIESSKPIIQSTRNLRLTKLLRPPSIKENLHIPMGCGTAWGLIRLIPSSFWFVMIYSKGASWFLPTQGSDVSASFFRTAFTNSHGQKGGVAFGEKGHDVHDKRRISIGLR